MAFSVQLPAMSVLKKFTAILKILCNAHLSPFDLLLHILDPSNSECEFYRACFYKDDEKFRKLVDHITGHHLGQEKFKQLPHVFDAVCPSVSTEMDLLTNMEGTPRSIKELTPDILHNWSLNKCIRV